MIDPVTLFFCLAMLSWLVGLISVIVGLCDPYSDGIGYGMIGYGIVIWVVGSLPLTAFWAILWVIITVFGD